MGVSGIHVTIVLDENMKMSAVRYRGEQGNDRKYKFILHFLIRWERMVLI